MWTAYLVTTLDRVADGQFHRLIESLDLSEVNLIVGCRGFDSSQLPIAMVTAVPIPLETSLSKARNILLSQYPPNAHDLVFFPDDDCWLPAESLKVAQYWLDQNSFLIGVVDTDLGEYAKIGQIFQVDLELALKNAASAALFFRGSTLEGFLFDEKLGLGASFKAGEDLDLVLSAMKEGFKGSWTPDLRIGHPKKDRSMEYFPGSIAALKLNSRGASLLKLLALRRVVHGIVFMFQRKLSPRDLLLALKAMFLSAR